MNKLVQDCVGSKKKRTGFFLNFAGYKQNGQNSSKVWQDYRENYEVYFKICLKSTVEAQDPEV